MRAFRGMPSLYEIESHLSTNNPIDVPYILCADRGSRLYRWYKDNPDTCRLKIKLACGAAARAGGRAKPVVRPRSGAAASSVFNRKRILMPPTVHADRSRREPPETLMTKRDHTTASTCHIRASRSRPSCWFAGLPVLHTAAHLCWLAVRTRIDCVPARAPLCQRVPVLLTAQPRA